MGIKNGTLMKPKKTPAIFGQSEIIATDGKYRIIKVQENVKIMNLLITAPPFIIGL